MMMGNLVMFRKDSVLNILSECIPGKSLSSLPQIRAHGRSLELPLPRLGFPPGIKGSLPQGGFGVYPCAPVVSPGWDSRELWWCQAGNEQENPQICPGSAASPWGPSVFPEQILIQLYRISPLIREPR